jgi:phosphoribosylformylglycinamidine synthase
MGFTAVGEVRQGKYIEIELADGDKAEAKAAVESMCRQLLANPVIENYTVDVVPQN